MTCKSKRANALKHFIVFELTVAAAAPFEAAAVQEGAAQAGAAANSSTSSSGSSTILTPLPHMNVQHIKILVHLHSRCPSGHNFGKFCSKILGGNFPSCEESRRSKFSRSSRRSR
jgi:hypothetical protein